MRYGLALLLLVLVAGCGGEAQPVPDVRGERLDVAVDELEDEGLDYEILGGGTFGVVVKEHWFVCEQRPEPGETAERVELVVDRACPLPPPPYPPVVPDVLFQPLDDAREELADAGVRAVVVSPPSAGPIRDESNWTVCEQRPGPGERGEEVELTVERECHV